MQIYRLSYRKDEWVSVEVGFADDVNINEMDHESIAARVAASGDLTSFETWEDSHISESSIEVEEIGEGVPDVVIGNDGTVMLVSEYTSIKNESVKTCENIFTQQNT